VPVLDAHTREQINAVEELIKSEVNIKTIEYLTDTEGFIKKKIKPNFKTLGARMGAKMKNVAAAIGKMNQHEIGELERNKTFVLNLDGEQIEINVQDAEIIAEDIPGWSVANKDTLTVALDITITTALKEEGNARELVNRIQKIRKDSNFDLTDRIDVEIEDYEPFKSTIINFSDYICAEILADAIKIVPKIENGTEIDINDALLNIFISKK